jgi:hypothetical protein
MAEVHVVFTASDDKAAIAVLDGDWRPPVYRDERLRPDVLAELAALLTGREGQEIAADPRHGVQVAEFADEEGGEVEAGLITITDTLTRALAAADTEALSAAAVAWSYGAVDTVQELATVARHAAAAGHHMYSFWHF